MKIKTLNLLIVLAGLTILMTGCPKDRYSPSLSLDIQPYVVYYNDTKYTLYDDDGNKIESIDPNVEKLGDIQSYIDLNSKDINGDDGMSKFVTYTIDDKGDFWSAEYLNNNFLYPKYRVSGYGDTEPTVAVTYSDEIGITRGDTIDLGLASTETESGYFTFTYTATDEGAESTVKKVHLRVYNSFYNLEGQYIDRVSLIAPNAGATDWIEGVSYSYGATKIVKFSVDGSIDKKMKLNRLLNNRKLKGVIKGESNDFSGDGTSCAIGTKKGDKTEIEILIKGKAVADDSDGTILDTYVKKVINNTPTVDPDTIQTLVVISDLGTGKIQNVTLKDFHGKDIEVPLIALEYEIRRYKMVSVSESDTRYYNGHHWKLLSPNSGEGKWQNNIRETYVKAVYYTGDIDDPESNSSKINAASGH